MSNNRLKVIVTRSKDESVHLDATLLEDVPGGCILPIVKAEIEQALRDATWRERIYNLEIRATLCAGTVTWRQVGDIWTTRITLRRASASR